MSKINTFFWIQRASEYVEKLYWAPGNFLKASEKILKIISKWGAYTKEATEGPACNIQDNFYRRFSEFRKQLIHLLLHHLLFLSHAQNFAINYNGKMCTFELRKLFDGFS